MKRVFILLIAVLVLGGCLSHHATRRIDDGLLLVPAEKVAHYQKNIVWATPGGVKLTLDASWPDGQGPFPVLVWIHGGAWADYSKEANMGLAKYVTNRGFVVFNINYRMFPEVTMKTIVEDAMGAIIWAKDHAAEYNGDPKRIAVAGHSAGGHLTAMIAVAANDPYFTPTYTGTKGNDAKVNAAVVVSGVLDLVERSKNEKEHTDVDWTGIMGGTYEQNPEIYKKCSPVSYVRQDLPPQLVIYAGEEDLLKDNEDWYNRLKAAGASVEKFMEPGRNHLWVIWHWEKDAKETYDRMIKFLDEQLKGK